MSLERLEEKQDSQKVTIAELRYELNQRKEEENTLRTQLQTSTVEMERMREEGMLMATEKKIAVGENAKLRAKCDWQSEQVTALTEQIGR